MKKYAILAIVFVGLLILPASVYCAQWQDLVEQTATGKINWTKGVVQAKGIGAPPEKYYGKPQARPMALRAAKLDAMRNLLEATKGVRINSTTLVKNFAITSDIIMSQVEGMVKGAQIVHQEYMSDGTVEVIIQMSLMGGFAQLILPKEIKQVESIRPVPPVHKEPLPPIVKKPSAPAPKPVSEVFTGMVIDARGINARPAMAPKILNEKGEEVYGSAYVSREFAVQQGMSGYAKDLTAAQSNPRVTNSPLTVKGLRTEGHGRSDIVISNADASRLRSASEHLTFLKKCRVMIVVD
ncbi:MAG: LPP20 family lipoprotein [Desulfobacteraceae bacterium]|uniref:LPP20 family lipoprotein n=1 Tax=Candidatus Desulfaltia bathyphila TaxID=2841697 RepID=A0A8J6N3J4_9BACT|nr:LPP20 family lipoprotein [Candidatus Desulfaltia bathyphila]MBL7196150.1 LPP20 family lipoprotein [Desulfobacterales bacterium]